jgi:hypothetical protein
MVVCNAQYRPEDHSQANQIADYVPVEAIHPDQRSSKCCTGPKWLVAFLSCQSGLPNFRPKNLNSGKFRRVLQMKIWYILWLFDLFHVHTFWPFGIYCDHLVHFVAIWYILWPFGIFLPVLPASVVVG